MRLGSVAAGAAGDCPPAAPIRPHRERLESFGGPLRFLDPAVGTGVFYSALLEHVGRDAIAAAVGCEKDEAIATAARDLWADAGLRVRTDDFTELSKVQANEQPFDLILANPLCCHGFPG